MKVVNLGTCGNLLRVWGQVRTEIMRGRLNSFAVTMTGDGEEIVLFAGEYEASKDAAARAAMRLSWEMSKAADFKISQL